MPDYEFTDEQRAILGHDGTLSARVLAGPGTGKSATMIAMLEQMAGDIERKVKLLTFTRAATAELAGEVATHGLDGIKPSTLHAFAIAVLMRNPGCADFPEPFRLADDWEGRYVVEGGLAKRIGCPVPQIRKLIAEMSANWWSLRTDVKPEITSEQRARFNGAWQQHRKVYGYTLLAEPPYRLLHALQDHPTGLQGVEWDMLIVDEYQDLNACDLRVLLKLAERGASIIGVGDDDQSIYSFRKATPDGIRDFLTDYPTAQNYPLTINHRCGRNIIDWANHVIQGDPNRPAKQALICTAEAPDGEVALLSYEDNEQEAVGVGKLVNHLVNDEGLAPEDVLVLLRSMGAGQLPQTLKAAIENHGIAVADANEIAELLALDQNRLVLACLRLLVNRADALAWATIVHLTYGVGPSFTEKVYASAVEQRETFGVALIRLHAARYPDGPAASRARAQAEVAVVLTWLDANTPPDERPADGWGGWIAEMTDVAGHAQVTERLAEYLHLIDDALDDDIGLSAYLGQIAPVGKDIATAQTGSVRIMSMSASKGLTVEATVVVAAERGIMPLGKSDIDDAEERRLLFVAMTRSKKYLYCTWARQRWDSTAWIGAANVGGKRTPSVFFGGGPVTSQDGNGYASAKWQ